MTAPRLQYQQRDSSGYPPSSTMASPLISRDRPRPLVKRGRKGYQGRSPWLVSGNGPGLHYDEARWLAPTSTALLTAFFWVLQLCCHTLHEYSPRVWII